MTQNPVGRIYSFWTSYKLAFSSGVREVLTVQTLHYKIGCASSFTAGDVKKNVEIASTAKSQRAPQVLLIQLWVKLKVNQKIGS